MRALAGVSGGRKPFSRNRPRKEVLADYLSFQAAPAFKQERGKKKKTRAARVRVSGAYLACPATTIIASAYLSVNITKETPRGLPVLSPQISPLPNLGDCGPDGIRTRTF